MKIRMKGNSIRLRLTKSEIGRVLEGKEVRERVSFGTGREFNYSLVPRPGPGGIQAGFDERGIRVELPDLLAHDWASSDQISLSHHQPIGGQDTLFVLIEKDFACLKPRSHNEDESDLFTNPNEAHGNCQ